LGKDIKILLAFLKAILVSNGIQNKYLIISIFSTFAPNPGLIQKSLLFYYTFAHSKRPRSFSEARKTFSEARANFIKWGLRGPCPLPKGAPPRIWTNSLLKKENKIAFRKSEQKSIRGGLTGALPPC
jgi:hypothetical protein